MIKRIGLDDCAFIMNSFAQSTGCAFRRNSALPIRGPGFRPQPVALMGTGNTPSQTHEAIQRRPHGTRDRGDFATIGAAATALLRHWTGVGYHCSPTRAGTCRNELHKNKGDGSRWRYREEDVRLACGERSSRLEKYQVWRAFARLCVWGGGRHIIASPPFPCRHPRGHRIRAVAVGG